MPDGRPIRLGALPAARELGTVGPYPSQVRLRAFVAHVRQLIDPVAEDIQGPLAFKLDVGLEESTDPLWERDLDNYLFPIARDLPPGYVSVWATKGRAQDSFVTVGPARPVTPPEWTRHRIPRGPGSESAWKQTVRDAVAHAELIPAGPVTLQISLTVGPRRSWTALWKRTIDGLDAVLGRTYADREWNPQDGRIVRLGLHVRTDHTLWHEVEATIWARPADMTWPELRWFASMDEAERSAYLAGHRATLHPATGPPSALGGTARARSLRERSAATAQTATGFFFPVGLTELTTEEEFDNAVAAGHVMLKTDTAGPPKIHIRPARCRGVRASTSGPR